ncbi:MAG: hypothetical protein Q7T76_09035, partial [Ferruginibacter sp.]|nr:hypothetical protein [Ferruginibacter sp.]
AIFPNSYSIIQDNIIDNEPADVLYYPDFATGNLVGTSHAIYVTSGYSGVLIDGNTFNNCRGWAVQFNTSSFNAAYANTVSNNKFYRCFAVGYIGGGNQPQQNINWINNIHEKCGYLSLDHANAKVTLSGNKWSGVLDTITGSANFSMEAIGINRVKEFRCSDEFYGKTHASFGNSGCINISDDAGVGDLVFSNCIADKSNKFFIAVGTSLNLIGSLTVKNSRIGTGNYLNYTNVALAASPRYNIVFEGNDFTNNVEANQPVYANFGFIFSNNTVRTKSTASAAIYLGGWVTNAKDMIIKGNTFINEGSEFGFRATDASVNNKVYFQDNKLVGNVEIRLDSNTFKHRSNTFSTLTNTYTDNVAVVGTSGNYLVGTTTDNATDKLQVNGTVKSTQFKLSALNTAPASATATGTTGEIRITADYVYVCVATNTWVRNALTTWS